MTLEEAINHCEDVVKEYEKIKCIKALTLEERKYAEEYRQVAEWLKELKQLREQKCDRENSEIMKEVKDLSKRFDALINQMKEDKEAQLEKLKEEIRLQKRSLDWKERVRNAHTRPN